MILKHGLLPLLEMKTLLVQRLDTANFFGKISIYCDGKKLGALGFAECGEFEIPADARQVYVKINWHQSEPLKLEFTKNEEVFFVECNSSFKNIFLRPGSYLKLHRVKRKDLPTQKALKAFKSNFIRVAGLSTLILLLFAVFLLYTLYIAIFEAKPIWYVLSALALYNIYRISKGIRGRLKGQVE